MKRLLLIAISALVSFQLSAQNELDKRIVKVMQDELKRSIEMSLPESGKPVYVSYYVEHADKLTITGVLGNIEKIEDKPDHTRAAAKVLLGSLAESSQLKYYGALSFVTLPYKYDYDEMRRQLWLKTDEVYKKQSFEMADKFAHRDYGRKNERNLDDWTKVAPEVVYIDREKDVALDREQWTKNIQELSAILRDFPKINDSKVELNYHSSDVYMTNSDGAVVKQPYTNIRIFVQMAATDANGMKIQEFRVLTSDYLKNLPSMDNMKREIRDAAEMVTANVDAPLAKNSYRGPVLALGDLPGEMFHNLSRAALLGTRKDNLVIMFGSNAMDQRMNTRIIDRKITVKNITAPTTFEGRKLYGDYVIDAEGVRPKPELVLIENGILKNVLSDRVPKLNAPESTGSVLFCDGQFYTEPGILDVTASETMPYDKMKKELIKLAKKQSCPCAYILRSSGLRIYTYRVNLETGEEVLEKGLVTMTFEPMGMKLDNYDFYAVSKERQVLDLPSFNGPNSVIAPKAILFEDLKLTKQLFRESEIAPIKYPLAAGSK